MTLHKVINAKLILSLIVILFLDSCVTNQYIPVEKVEIIDAAGLGQKIIYNKSRQWFSEHYVSGESVVDYEDAAAGTVIGKGYSSIGSDFLGVIGYKIRYSIRVDTKDGKLRVTTKVLQHLNSDNSSIYDISFVTKSREDLAQKHLSEIVSSLKQYVTNPQAGSSSNW